MLFTGIATLYVQIKRTKSKLHIIQIELSNRKYESVRYNTFLPVITFCFVLLAIASFVIGYANNDTTTIAFGVILATMCAGQLYESKIKTTLYYSNNSIIVYGEVIAFRSIKEIKKRKLPIKGIYMLTTYLQDKVPINQLALDIIQERRKIKIS